MSERIGGEYNSMVKAFRRYFPVIAWCGVIFFFSSWQTPPSPKDTLLNFLLKKTAHLIEYAILYYLAFKALNPSLRFNSKLQLKTQNSTAINRQRTLNNYLIPLLFTIFYAMSDEIHQSFVPGRHGRATDVLIDTLGASLTILIASRGLSSKDRPFCEKVNL